MTNLHGSSSLAATSVPPAKGGSTLRGGLQSGAEALPQDAAGIAMTSSSSSSSNTSRSFVIDRGGGTGCHSSAAHFGSTTQAEPELAAPGSAAGPINRLPIGDMRTLLQHVLASFQGREQKLQGGIYKDTNRAGFGLLEKEYVCPGASLLPKGANHVVWVLDDDKKLMRDPAGAVGGKTLGVNVAPVKVS